MREDKYNKYRARGMGPQWKRKAAAPPPAGEEERSPTTAPVLAATGPQQAGELSLSTAASMASVQPPALLATSPHSCKDEEESSSSTRKRKIAQDHRDPTTRPLTSTPPPPSPTPALTQTPAPCATPSPARALSTGSPARSRSATSSNMTNSSSSLGLRQEWRPKATSSTAQSTMRTVKTTEKALPDPQLPSSPVPLHGIKLPKSRQAELTPDTLKGHFLQFLQSDRTGVYESQLLVEPAIIIDFINLLTENKDLAITVCNEEKKWNETWLTPAVRSFAEENGCTADTVNFHFTNKPERIYPALELLSSPHELTRIVDIFHGKRQTKMLIAASRAQILFRVIVWGILEQIEKGNSWLGQLKVEDLFILEVLGQLQLLILKDPVRKGDASPEDGALDVNNIWTIMDPFVLTADGRLPLYFTQFKHHLVTATAAEMQEKWFFEFLKYYPALASATARRNLLVGLYDNSKTFRFAKQTLFRDFFESDPNPQVDWRVTAKESDILVKTYFFKQNLLKRKQVFKDPDLVVVSVQKKQKINEGETPEDGEEMKSDILDDSRLVFMKPAEVMVQQVSVPEEELEQVAVEEGEAKDAVNPEQVVDEGKDAGKVILSGKLEQVAVKECEGKDAVKQATEEGNDAGKVVLSGEHELVALKEGEGEGAMKLEQVVEGKDAGKPQETVLVEEFGRTTGALLIFRRHSLTHTDEHVKVEDLDDIEMYGSSMNEDFLPYVIQWLLRICNMGYKLRNTWSTYKASIRGLKD